MSGCKHNGLLLCLVLSASGTSACVSTKVNAPEFEAQMPSEPESVQVVQEPVDVPNPAATVTNEEGAVRQETECTPLAEVDRPTGPSVEIGLTAPLAQGAWSVVGVNEVSPYTRYNCH